MADSSKLLMLAGAGAAVWWFYFRSPTPTPGATSPLTVVPPNPNAITGANTLDGIYARLVATSPSGQHGVDEWNSYLATAGNLTPPDPMPIFSAAVPGFARSQALTAAQYWAVMAPALKSQLGLSGLGIYGGLGALAMRRRA